MGRRHMQMVLVKSLGVNSAIAERCGGRQLDTVFLELVGPGLDRADGIHGISASEGRALTKLDVRDRVQLVVLASQDRRFSGHRPLTMVSKSLCARTHLASLQAARFQPNSEL